MFENLTLQVFPFKDKASLPSVVFKFKVPSFNTFAFITAKVPLPVIFALDPVSVIAILALPLPYVLTGVFALLSLNKEPFSILLISINEAS